MKETKKSICGIAYLIFFIPLLIDKSNETYRFHANQGLVLLIYSIVIGIVGRIIPVIGWYLILPLGLVFSFVLLVTGFINVIENRTKELPVIGRYKIIKMNVY